MLMLNTQHEPYSVDMIMDCAIVGGIAFFSTLAAGGAPSVMAAAYAFGLAFLANLALRRGLQQADTKK